jgi:RNA polymerase sigma factor (sigma-70 family)
VPLTHESSPTRDDTWFEGLFTEHVSSVYRYVVRRAARNDADDLTADVFATPWRKRVEVPAGQELAWLYRTAGFFIANHHRKSRPTPVEILPEKHDVNSPEAQVIADPEVCDVFATLGERDRQILLLAAWEGLRGNDLAEVLEVSRGGADAALSRARSRLHEAWLASAQVSDHDGLESPSPAAGSPHSKNTTQ